MTDPLKETTVDIRLRAALQSGRLPKELLVDGPAGTGKTYAILLMLHCLLADYPNIRVLVCRKTRASITESVLVTYEQEILPADGMQSVASNCHRRNRQAYDYPNGSTMVLGGLDKPDRILSTAWDIIYVNESIELEETDWDALSGRLDRPGRPAWLGYLIGDTNPGDPSHWLKKRFDEGRLARWQTSHEANPALFDGRDWTDAGNAYLARLDNLRGTRRKRFRDGLWAAGEGQWFETFGDHNVTTRAEFDPVHRVHLAVDSGVHTGAVWFQVEPGEHGPIVNIFGDFYSFNLPAFAAAGEMKGWGESLGVRRVDRGVTDPAYKASTAVGPTVLGEYIRAGLHLDPWPSYPGSVSDGLSLIESFVSIEPPQLFVHPRCTHVINAFANYKRAKRGGQWIDRPEDPQHPYEDIMDAVRGGLQDKFPEGRKPQPALSRVQASKVF